MLPNKHFAKYKIAEWFFAEKSCGMHYTPAVIVIAMMGFQTDGDQMVHQPNEGAVPVNQRAILSYSDNGYLI